MSDSPSANTPERAPFAPNPAFAEEWDNPEMTEFKRLEAEDRVAFANSHTQEEWREALAASARESKSKPFVLRRVPHGPEPVKVIRLNW